MRIGFTGTQSGMTNFQKTVLKEILLAEKCSEFIHGDCYGADAQANDISKWFVDFISIFPPDNSNKRAWCFNPQRVDRKWEWLKVGLINAEETRYIKVRWAPKDSYLERNRHIVDNCDMMIACPKEDKHTVRSGTWATIRYAWSVHRKIVIIPPIQRND
jgi:hypothetical protein